MFEAAKQRYLEREHLKEFAPRAALIDMDGVLFDSMPNHAKSWVTVFRSLGFHFEDREAYLHEGRTGRGTLEILYRRELHRDPTDEEVTRMYGIKARLFDEMPEAPVMPGSPEALDAIRRSGIERILVTGSGQRKLLDRLNPYFPGHFTEGRMVTAFDVTQGKPSPEPYLMGLKKAGVSVGQAVVIENAPLGIESGKAAGIFTVAVNTGILEDEVLLEAGCDVLLHSMAELAEVWPEIARPFSL